VQMNSKCPNCRKHVYKFKHGPCVRNLGLFSALRVQCPECSEHVEADCLEKHVENTCQCVRCYGGCGYTGKLSSNAMQMHVSNCPLACAKLADEFVKSIQTAREMVCQFCIVCFCYLVGCLVMRRNFFVEKKTVERQGV